MNLNIVIKSILMSQYSLRVTVDVNTINMLTLHRIMPNEEENIKQGC